VKPAIFQPSARETIRSFPLEVRKELRKAIFDLQRGHILAMPLSRPMPSVAIGVEELRIRDRAGIFRVFCYARLARGVLVFHAFTKKDRPNPEESIGAGKETAEGVAL
jgi:phage-related protein